MTDGWLPHLKPFARSERRLPARTDIAEAVCMRFARPVLESPRRFNRSIQIQRVGGHCPGRHIQQRLSVMIATKIGPQLTVVQMQLVDPA
jgi:hypothetical protein